MSNSLVFFEVTGSYFAVADPSVSGTINDPIVQAVSGLVTITPRLPKGYQAFVKDYLVQEAFNARQTISIIGNAIQGTWQLNFAGDLTGVMQFNVTPAALQAALEALPSIGAGNVSVAQGINPQSYDVDFINTLGDTHVLALVPSWNNLSDANGYDCTITVAVTSTGGAEIIADTSISLPHRKARIWSGVLSTIDYVDTPGVMLAANDPMLGLQDDPTWGPDLVYDVSYSAVTFNKESQMLGNVAFVAPTDSTPVCLTSPDTDLVNWKEPIHTVWTPQPPQLTVVTNWRHRGIPDRAVA
jgi:hypothetical protein